MFDAETVAKIAQLGTEGAAVQVEEIPGDPTRVIVAQAGQHKIHQLPPADRDHQVDTLNDLTAAAENWTAPTVWHNEAEVIALCDDEHRRDRITFKLTPSPQFKLLVGLETNANACVLDQRSFIRMLKFDLADCVVNDGLLPNIRKLEFKRSSDGTGNVQHGKESLGRAVEASVQGTTDIPEWFDVQIPLYVSAGEKIKHDVRIDLDIDTQNERFIVRPLPGRLHDAIHRHQANIAERLVNGLGDDVSVYYGKP